MSPIPYSMETIDGFLAKMAKHKGTDYLTKDCTDADQPLSWDVVYDGNASFCNMKKIQVTCGISAAMCLTWWSKKGHVVFSAGKEISNSVKSLEWQRRGTGEKLIVKGPATKKRKDGKGFTSNDLNKVQFMQLLLKVWSLEIPATYFSDSTGKEEKGLSSPQLAMYCSKSKSSKHSNTTLWQCMALS